MTHSNIRNSSALADWNFSVKFCLTNFAIDCCTFSPSIPYPLCKQIRQVLVLESCWFLRFYLKIRLTKILHYEVFKVQRTFFLPAKAVRLPVLCYVFVWRNVIYYTISLLKCQHYFKFIQTLFSLSFQDFHLSSFAVCLHCFETASL